MTWPIHERELGMLDKGLREELRRIAIQAIVGDEDPEVRADRLVVLFFITLRAWGVLPEIETGAGPIPRDAD
jgi:hypothetical protein